MKICTKCNILKSNLEYYKSSFNTCKQCRKQYTKEYKKKNRKKYNELNKKYLKNPINMEKYKLAVKKWKLKNKQAVYEYNKNWKNNNKIRLNELARAHDKKRKQEDINYKLKKLLRNRLYDALKGNYKVGSAVRDLGCTIEQLKLHLEYKFQSGMTWNNWTINGWHIDHIIPLSSFNLSNKEELLIACNYTNLQPMWAKDNLTKSNKL